MNGRSLLSVRCCDHIVGHRHCNRSSKQKTVAARVKKMTAASILRNIVIKHGQRLGTFSGVGIFKDNDNTFVLAPNFYWWDIFAIFPIYSLHVINNAEIAKVLNSRIENFDKKNC